MSNQRPTIASISLAAVRHNIQAIAKAVGPAAVMAVVKADAYGHGMIPVARAALSAGAAWLGVATVDEALALRDEGFTCPILLLGPSFPDDAPHLASRDISVAVGSLDVARSLSAAAEKAGRTARLHIKADTGMGRFGFWWEDLITMLPMLAALPAVRLEGCFTHFAASDAADETYTKLQLSRFRLLVSAAVEKGIHFDLIHSANSGAILQHPQTWYDLVRAGVMMYGMMPDPETRPSISLEPVMTLATRLIEVRQHPPGRCLSYGCTFRTDRPSVIGIIPIGYGDGYSRRMSNRGAVIIRGRRAPVVGRVCMDQVLVDLTDIPGACVGDPVLLWGKRGQDCLPVEEVARWMETITYEVTCALGRRVPRKYED
ncbi:MAG TPA: alanine racemase [Candidatus Sumerlaeota bacterium]|nr:alanine racemase [Candidatus Sumerlaeota bacterium]